MHTRTHEKLERQFARFEKARVDLWQKLKGHSPRALKENPEEGRWSILEICEHLMLSEKLSLCYMIKKTKAPELIPPIGIRNHMKSIALNFTLGTSFRLKAPPMTATVGSATDLHELFEQWSLNRDELNAFVISQPETVLRRGLFKHPLAGRLNMKMTFDFMMAHFRHHESQMNYILKNRKG